MNDLLCALRQYRHNHGKGDFVFGYDKETTDKVFAAMKAQLTEATRHAAMQEVVADEMERKLVELREAAAWFYELAEWGRYAPSHRYFCSPMPAAFAMLKPKRMNEIISGRNNEWFHTYEGAERALRALIEKSGGDACQNVE